MDLITAPGLFWSTSHQQIPKMSLQVLVHAVIMSPLSLSAQIFQPVFQTILAKNLTKFQSVQIKPIMQKHKVLLQIPTD